MMNRQTGFLSRNKLVGIPLEPIQRHFLPGFFQCVVCKCQFLKILMSWNSLEKPQMCNQYLQLLACLMTELSVVSFIPCLKNSSFHCIIIFLLLSLLTSYWSHHSTPKNILKVLYSQLFLLDLKLNTTQIHSTTPCERMPLKREISQPNGDQSAPVLSWKESLRDMAGSPSATLVRTRSPSPGRGVYLHLIAPVSIGRARL